MKIAVTGGSGFIGKWLMNSVPKEWECIILGSDKDKKDILINKRLFKYFLTDYTKRDLEEKLVDVDAVVHLAATRSGSNEFDTYISNMSISDNIFQSCITNKIDNIVCLSSISVYSDSNNFPWSEEQNVSPLSYYGISKLTMENLAEFYNRKNDLNIKSLRVSQVVGHGERTGHMLMTFINRAYKKQVLNVFGKGKGRREYIYVKDVAAAIIRALMTHKRRGVYNIGTNENMSHLELAEMINEIFDNHGNINFISEIEEDTSIYLMDINKAKQDLEWSPKWTIKNGIKDIKLLMSKPV